MISRGRRAAIGIALSGAASTTVFCGDSGGAPDGGADVSTLDVRDDVVATDADASPIDWCLEAKKTHDVVGCKYLAFDVPDGVLSTSFGCAALLVSNPNDVGAKISLVYRGSTPDVSNVVRLVVGQGRPFTYAALTNDTIPPNTTAVVALTQGDSHTNDPNQGIVADCPFPAAFDAANVTAPDDGTTIGIELQSSSPVFVTYVDAFGLAPESVEQSVTATSLRSSESWDVRHREVGLSAPGRPASLTYCADGNSYPTYPQSFAVGSASLGQATLPQVDAGSKAFATELDLVRMVTADDLLIGREINSTQPVGLWSANRDWIMPYIDGTAGFSNIVLHAVPPPSAWGHEYAAVPYPPRYPNVADPPQWRIIGDVDGTLLSYVGSTPSGAPTSIDAGQLAVFSASEPFFVASQDAQHPFYLDESMPSCAAVVSCASQLVTEDCRGAPTTLSVQPHEEFSTHSVLLTNPNFPETWLVVVRHANNGVLDDVQLDCAGTISGWKAIGASDYQYAYVALSRDDFEPQTYGGGTCALGPHVLDSASPFGVSVWGWGTPAAAGSDDAGTLYEGPQRAAYAFSVVGRGPHVFPQRPPSTN